MEKYKDPKISSLIYKLLAVISVAAIGTLGTSLAGCNKTVGIELTVDKIFLDVGETRSIAPYVLFTPRTAKDTTFSLVSDSDCVAVSGTSVSAVSEGEASITVSTSGGSAELKVLCSYGQAYDWDTVVDGNTVQTVMGAAQPVTFGVKGIAAERDIYWYVNGKRSHIGDRFTFVPDGFGRFDVSVNIGGTSRSFEVLIYRSSEAFGIYSGELDQINDFSPVVFSVEQTVDTRNPPSYIVWTVNGENVGYGETFEFVPTEAGEYSVRLYVNGLERKIAGKEEIAVTAVGDRAPRGSVCIKEDKVFVVWRDGEYARGITLTAPDGSRRSVSSGDAAYAELFGAGYIDMTDIIEVCADTPKSYVFRILGSAAGEPFEFLQYPSEAQKYMSKKIFVGDCFVSSSAEAADALTELYVCGKSYGELYLSRDADIDEVLSALADRADLLNVRADILTPLDNIVAIELRDAVNTPVETYADETAINQYTELPHIEYSESNRRGQSFGLFIERQKASAVVTNSEQLLYCVLNGIRPIAEDNAKTVYDRARATLYNIIGKDYDDVQKVHAVYDWVQWATRRAYTDELDAAERFTDGAFAVTGTRGTVTDEGAAKAVALLCGMEGIPSEIVKENGRYFTKVTADGNTFEVDAFGGKNSTGSCEIVTGGSQKLPIRDILSHAGLGDTFFLQKHIYNSVYFDYYIDRLEFDDIASVRAAVFYKFDGQSYGNVTIRDYATSQITNTEYGVEFKLDPEISETEKAAVYGNIVTAVGEYGKAFGTFSNEDIKIENYNGIVRVHVPIRQR